MKDLGVLLPRELPRELDGHEVDRIAVEGGAAKGFKRLDAKEWHRIVNLALWSKARVIAIIDDGRNGL